MVSSAEITFFSERADHYAGNEGAIVDLGCWLGSTSIALARGVLSHVTKGETRQEKVFGFDTFLWEDWMPAAKAYCVYRPGDSFLPEARRLVRDHGGGAVELIQEDLGLYHWESGPIKILLVDAMKQESVACQIVRGFFPSLVTGSLLIHQDFKHYYTSWIHVLQYRLRHYFRFYRSVPKSGTVAFEILRPIARDAIDTATDLSTISEDEIDAAFRYSVNQVEPADAPNIAAAHVMHYIHLGRKDQALARVDLYRLSGMIGEGEFPEVLAYLDQLA